MSGGASIELDDVTKRYETRAGTVHAVDGISLHVRAGISLAITGPSGCGKSTLLGLIAGLERPTAGRVSIGGREISSLPDVERARVRRHELGLVFQSDNLLPFLTAAENISLQLALHDPRESNARGLELLSELGLAEEADRFPDQLSGGQRQRMAVARALIHRPSLIMADEPTGSLDAQSAVTVVDLLLAAQRVSGATLVLVTHEPNVARRLDRTVSMLDGHVADPETRADDVAAAPPTVRPRA
ncbi:MAG: ABC transporter ATP-binding protein [Actinomycetota bacterium]|nr:ABC transporter ATP-binding protein [Actinomycetota bacterium]